MRFLIKLDELDRYARNHKVADLGMPCEGDEVLTPLQVQRPV